MVNTPTDDSRGNKAAILKELESVQSLLNENQSLQSYESVEVGDIEYKAPTLSPKLHPIEEFQIPLLDPSKSTTYELDFSKPKPKPVPEKKVAPPPKPREEDIPVIDDIQSSSSLFDDKEESFQSKPSLVTERELKDKAQLIVQDLINDAITELEEKLDHLIPNLEERLKKKLEKAMDDYIAKALRK